MKRAITSVAAAALALGMMAPAAFAATTSSSANTLVAAGGKTITLDGSNLYTGVQAGTGMDAGTTTTYFPIYYLMQSLTKAGYANTYNPSSQSWNLQIPGVDASKIAVAGGVGTGSASISINGFVVKRFNAKFHTDFAGGKNAAMTTYFPLYYLGNVLSAAGFSNAWTGTSFGFTSNYGAAAGATLSAASSSVVANGVSTDTVTVAVVDANGHVVRNFNGYASVNYTASGKNGAVSFYNPTTKATSTAKQTNIVITNGVGTFTVQSNGNAGVTDTLAVTGVFSGYGETNEADTTTWNLGTASIGTQAQVATSIKVTSDYAVLANNNGGETNNVYAEVDDQTGNPMLSGTYPVTFTVSGPAQFTNATTTASTAGFGSSTGFTNASATLQSEKGVNGSLAVTATSGTLTGHLSLTEASAQSASKLSITGPTTAPTTDSGAVSYTVNLEDNNGLPVKATADVPVTITTSDASGATVVFAAGKIAAGSSSATFTVADTMAENLTITAASSGLTTGTLQEAYGTGAPVHLTFSNTTTAPKAVSSTNPSTTLTVSVTDANNNPIKVAGTEVDLKVDGASTGITNGHAVVVNGTTISTAAGNVATAVIKGYTDANGVASFTIAPQGYAGDNWMFTAAAPAQSNITAGIASAVAEGQLNVENQLGSNITASYTDGGVSKTNFSSGDAVTLVETVKDANGNPVSGDQVKVTFSNPTAVSSVTPTLNENTAGGVYYATTNGSGQATFTFTATGAGSTTVSAVDTASGSNGSSSFTTAAGSKYDGVGVFDSNGNLISWVDLSGTPHYAATQNYVNASSGNVAVTLKAVDANGNPIVTPNAINVDLSAATGHGTFRTSVGGVDSPDVVIPAGTAGYTVYYVNGTSADTQLNVQAKPDLVLSALAGHTASSTITGTVKDANGDAIAGVVVLVTDTTASPNVTYTATTDSTGTFTLSVPSAAQGHTFTAQIVGVNSASAGWADAGVAVPFS